MNIGFHLSMCLGVGVGNALIYFFLWGKPFLESLGIGVLAAVIALILVSLFGLFR